MSAVKPVAPSPPQKRMYLAALGAVIVTFLVDNTVDVILEDEDIIQHLLSPPRVLAVALLAAAIVYQIALALRNRNLKKSHQLQLAAMESSIDGIAIFGAESKVLYSNKAHTRMFGYESEEEICGAQWSVFYPADELERFDQQVRPVLERTKQWRGEITGTRKDGSRFPQAISLTRLENGCIIRVVRDISEKKRNLLELERRAQELEEKNRELETFSYSLSHDMRSYITRVSSAAQLLLDLYQRPGDEEGTFLAHSISQAADGMGQLVESIQMLAALSQAQLKLERVDLSAMVAALAAELSLSDRERAVDFDIETGVYAICDPKLVRVALQNLLANAWKYTGRAAQARIQFGTETSGDKKVIFVRDNGMGFDPADAAKLFQPFLRLEGAKEFPGTGVGLAMVQRVIQLHKGEVWGVGKPGQEATFYFSLPGATE